jgi:phosphopantothenoylcysteine decarboxylase/phosphopantothenate--cysteine ligase
LAQLADGAGEDPVTAAVTSATGQVLVVAAVKREVWERPSTKTAVGRLRRSERVAIVEPRNGDGSAFAHGAETMVAPETIARVALSLLGPRDLSGARIVVTAGPTIEDIDPVRFLGNRSSGKMGFALAERAATRGAAAKLIAGPVALATPRGVERTDVRGALAMQRALVNVLGPGLGAADALLMSAAVADYRPSVTSTTKIKRSAEVLTLELLPNPDLLAEIGEMRAGRMPMLVGFAVETATDERMVVEGRRKLESKKLDLVVVNGASDAFGRDDNRAILVDRGGSTPLGILSKRALADRILDRVASYLSPFVVLGGRLPASAPLESAK